MNPWPALPSEAPFVLPDDQEAIARFNVSAPERTRLELTLLPEPFVGSVDASVGLLTLNLGVQPTAAHAIMGAAAADASRHAQ